MHRSQFLRALIRGSLNELSRPSDLRSFSRASYLSDGGKNAAAKSSPIVTKRQRYNPFKLHRYSITERLEQLAEERKWILNTTHPFHHVREFEKELLNALCHLENLANQGNPESVASLLKDLINKHTTQHLTAQRLMNMMTSFICQLDSNWIMESVVPLLPGLAKELNLLSHHVLGMSIAAYHNQENLSEKVDQFICSTFNQLGNDPRSVLIPPLSNGMLSTMAKSSL